MNWFEGLKDTTDYYILQRLHSKKNAVHKLQLFFEDNSTKTVVIKDFGDNISACHQEKRILQLLAGSGISTPEVLCSGDNYILMEYIEGTLLIDILDRLETFIEPANLETEAGKKAPRLTDYAVITKIPQWLESFYAITRNSEGRKIILGDIHLRNFIYNGKLYGLDFEECAEGDYETDCGKLCAFILTYTPEYTEIKARLVRDLLYSLEDTLKLDRPYILNEIIRELEAMNLRRGLTGNYDIGMIKSLI